MGNIVIQNTNIMNKALDAQPIKKIAENIKSIPQLKIKFETINDIGVSVSNNQIFYIPKPTSEPQTYVAPAVYADGMNSTGGIKSISDMILAEMPFLQNQENTVKYNLELQKLTMKLITEMSPLMKNLVDSRTELLENQTAQLNKSSETGMRTSGLIGLLSGLFEAIVGLAMAMGSGGVATAVGAFMIIDGLTKAFSGALALADPKFALSHSNLENFVKNGLFGVFGDNAQIVQTISTLVMTVLSFGATLTSSLATITRESIGAMVKQLVKQVIMGIYTVANAISTCTGLLMSSIDANNNSKNSDEKNAIISAASMGIMALTLQGILQSSGLHDLMVSKWGKDTTAIVEMSLSLALSVGAMAVSFFAMRQPSTPLPKNNLNNAAGVKFSDNVESFIKTITASTEKFSNIMPEVMQKYSQFFAISNLNLSMQSAVSAGRNFEATKINNESELSQVLIKNMEAVIQAIVASENKLAKSFQSVAGQIVQVVTDTYKTFNQIVRSAVPPRVKTRIGG